jgi:hypothetical protein
MRTFLNDLLGGWKEARASQGFSYQVSRDGRRRVIPIDNYGRRGTIDQTWLVTGEFSDEQMHRRFRDYNLRSQVRARRQVTSA